MFSIETRVNGMIVNVTQVLNDGLEVDGKHKYDVEYHSFSEPKIINFCVFHDRLDRIEDLTLRIFKRIDKEIKKYNDSCGD